LRTWHRESDASKQQQGDSQCLTALSTKQNFTEAKRMVIDTLSPTAQQWLQREAERSHVGVEAYVARLIEATAAGAEISLAPGSREWEHELRSGTVSVPSVFLAQMDRESLYSDDLYSDDLYSDGGN